MAVQADRDGFAMKISFVPEDFELESDDVFDPVYMRALFDRGEAEMVGENAWFTVVRNQD